MALNISAWSIRNPLPSIVFSIILLVLGWVSFTKLAVTRLPSADIPVISVAESLIGAARAAGITTLLVSGGFNYFTDRVRDRLKLGYAYSNELVIEAGKLAGRTTGPLVDANGKAGHLARLMGELGLKRDQVLAIGDGANDLPMMALAGTSIAYHAKAVVKAKADYALDYVGLDGVLGLFRGSDSN